MATTFEPVAITGMGIRCAVAGSVSEFLEALLQGRSGLEPVTLEGGFQTPAGMVRVASHPYLDRTTLLATPAAGEALNMAKLLPLPGVAGPRAGVVIGHPGDTGVMDDFHDSLEGGRIGRSQARKISRAALQAPAEAIAREFRLGGPRLTVSIASASGAGAITTAAELLQEDRTDIMVAGGVATLTPLLFEGFRCLGLLSPEACTPFCQGQGMNLGEAAAFLVLERAEAARKRRAPILAYLAGYGFTNDAYHHVIPDPLGRGLAQAISQALEGAGVAPEDIQYVHAHGVGVEANDLAETKALKSALGQQAGRVPVSTTKPLVGHTINASGAIGAIASILAMQNGFIPAIPNFTTPWEGCDLDYVPGSPRFKPAAISLVNSTGFGGVNVALTLSREALPPHRNGSSGSEPLVGITGLGVVSPSGVGKDAFRDSIILGVPAPRPADLSEKARRLLGQRHLGRIDLPSLDEAAPPRTARNAGGAERYTLAAAQMALEDAGLNITGRNAHRVGLIMASSTGPLTTFGKFRRQVIDRKPSYNGPALFTNLVFNAPAAHACIQLGIKGLASVLLGEAAALEALGYAHLLIRRGGLDACLVVAADEVTEELLVARNVQGVLSRGMCRPFSHDHDGTTLSEGACAFLLERQDRIEERAARSYAAITGYAMTGESGRGDQVLRCQVNPSGERWADTFRQAMDDADVSPKDLDYVAAAGCGYPLTDQAEAGAIRAALGDCAYRVPVSAICSLVGYAGPTSPALGVAAGLLGMREGWVPPTLGLELEHSRCRLRHVTGSVQPRPVDTFLASSFSWMGSYAAAIFQRTGGRK